jgi:hypothetical protein
MVRMLRAIDDLHDGSLDGFVILEQRKGDTGEAFHTIDAGFLLVMKITAAASAESGRAANLAVGLYMFTSTHNSSFSQIIYFQ